MDYLEVFFRTLIRGPPTKITRNRMLSLRNGVCRLITVFMLAINLVDNNEGSSSADVRAQAQSYETKISELFSAVGAGAMQRCFCIIAKGYSGLVSSKV